MGILWAKPFETYRRTIMSASMVALRGRLQREGEVTHVIVDRITDLTDLLRQVGSMAFPHLPSRGDVVKYPSPPDRGEGNWHPRSYDSYHRPFDGGADPEDVVRIKSRDFR